MKLNLIIGLSLSSLILFASAARAGGNYYYMICNRTGYTGEYKHGIGVGVDGNTCHLRLDYLESNQKYVRFDKEVCKPKYYQFTAHRSDGYFARMQVYIFDGYDYGTALFRDKNGHLGTCILRNRRPWPW